MSPPILKFGFHKHMMLNLTLEKRFWLGATPQKSIIMQMSFLEGIWSDDPDFEQCSSKRDDG